MTRLSTCKACNKKLQPSEKFIHSSKTYCESCYVKIKRDSEEYKQLIEYICVNYNINAPTGFMLKQIKEMKDECSYTYGGMTYTLWYCKDVIGKELLSKYGVALIRYYYDDASAYFMQQEESKRKMEKLKDVELKTKIVKVNKQNKYETNNNSLINLNNLLGGDENKL